ncbi:MAG TPA: hypothetical protein VGQ83_41330 [Polyangia bacterium]|jgi:hypothetical protein
MLLPISGPLQMGWCGCQRLVEDAPEGEEPAPPPAAEPAPAKVAPRSTRLRLVYHRRGPARRAAGRPGR